MLLFRCLPFSGRLIREGNVIVIISTNRLYEIILCVLTLDRTSRKSVIIVLLLWCVIDPGKVRYRILLLKSHRFLVCRHKLQLCMYTHVLYTVRFFFISHNSTIITNTTRYRFIFTFRHCSKRIVSNVRLECSFYLVFRTRFLRRVLT